MQRFGVIFALAVALALPASADEIGDAVHACDLLTSSANDPDRRVDPVVFDEIDVPAAIDACAKAIAVSPEDGKLHFELGRAYESDRQFTTAWKHYLDGAELGAPIAMRGLARLAYFGWGYDKDFALSDKWYQRASDLGMALASRELGVNLIADDTPPELHDYDRALKLLMLAREQGDNDTTRFIAKVYSKGPPDLRDFKKAEEWYLLCAEKEAWPHCMNDTGRFYSITEGLEPDWEKARYWFEKATEAGNADGPHNLALIYYNGNGVEVDYEKAVELFKLASDRGILLATHNVGVMLDFGQGSEPDPKQAAAYLYLALTRGFQFTLDGLLNKPDEGYAQETLKEIELLLRNEGFMKSGGIDGVFDGETFAALKLAFGSAL